MKWLIGIGAGFAGILVGGAVMIANGADASTPNADTIVGIEHVTNPYGDRFIMVRTYTGNATYGIWVTEECAATLHRNDEWPSAAPECNY